MPTVRAMYAPLLRVSTIALRFFLRYVSRAGMVRPMTEVSMNLPLPKRAAKHGSLTLRVQADLIERLDAQIERLRTAHPERAAQLTRTWLVVELLEHGLKEARRG